MTGSPANIIVLDAEMMDGQTFWGVSAHVTGPAAVEEHTSIDTWLDDHTPGSLGPYGSWSRESGEHGWLWWRSEVPIAYNDHKGVVYRIRPRPGGWRAEILLGLSSLLPTFNGTVRHLTHIQVGLVLGAAMPTHTVATPQAAIALARKYIEIITHDDTEGPL